MTIRVNGRSHQVADGTTLDALIAELGVKREGIAIARNDDVVPRHAIATTTLSEGDVVEIIVAVAGG